MYIDFEPASSHNQSVRQALNYFLPVFCYSRLENQDLLRANYYSPAAVVEIEEMEDELSAISAELASSIRREMDLEELVERLQTEIANPQAPAKRTMNLVMRDRGSQTPRRSEGG